MLPAVRRIIVVALLAYLVSLVAWSQSGLESAGFALTLLVAVAALSAGAVQPSLPNSVCHGARWGLALFRPDGMCLARISEPSPGILTPRGDYRRELLRHPDFRAGWRPMPGMPPDLAAYFTLFRRIEN